MAILYFRFGELDNFRKRYSEALLKLEDARRFSKESELGDGSTLMQTDRAAAQSCFQLGKFEKAKVYLNEAVDLVDLHRPPYEKIADMCSLAQCEAALGNDVQAEKIFKEAIELGREQFVASKSNLDRGACRRALKYCHLAYAGFLRQHKRVAEADKVQAQARTLEKARLKIKKP